MRLPQGLALLPLLLLPLALQAGEVRVCLDDLPHPPYILQDREGIVQVLMRMAAERSGMDLRVDVVPAARCRETLRRDAHDMMAVAAYVEGNIGAGVFPPLRGKEPDPGMAAVNGRMVVVRRRGSAVDWDGQRFLNLKQPVMTVSGQAAPVDLLQRLKVPYDSGARQSEQVLLKLIAGRGDAVVMLEITASRLASAPAYADKVEILPLPFVERPFYFVFSHGYYAAHRAEAEAFWQAVARLKTAPEFLHAIRDLH